MLQSEGNSNNNSNTNYLILSPTSNFSKVHVTCDSIDAATLDISVQCAIKF